MKNAANICYVLICVVLLLIVLNVKFEWYGNAGYKDGQGSPNNTVSRHQLTTVNRYVKVHDKNIQTLYDNLKDLETKLENNDTKIDKILLKIERTQSLLEKSLE